MKRTRGASPRGRPKQQKPTRDQAGTVCIEQLPSETLEHILLFAIASSRGRSLHSILSVCRHWRALICDVRTLRRFDWIDSSSSSSKGEGLLFSLAMFTRLGHVMPFHETGAVWSWDQLANTSLCQKLLCAAIEKRHTKMLCFYASHQKLFEKLQTFMKGLCYRMNGTDLLFFVQWSYSKETAACFADKTEAIAAFQRSFRLWLCESSTLIPIRQARRLAVAIVQWPLHLGGANERLSLLRSIYRHELCNEVMFVPSVLEHITKKERRSLQIEAPRTSNWSFAMNQIQRLINADLLTADEQKLSDYLDRARISGNLPLVRSLYQYGARASADCVAMLRAQAERSKELPYTRMRAVDSFIRRMEEIE